MLGHSVEINFLPNTSILVIFQSLLYPVEAVLLSFLLLEVPGSDIKNDIGSVYKNVENCRHDESRHNIEDGMLLNKHGREDNTYRNSKAGILHPLLTTQSLAVHNCKIYAYRVVYMDARPQVGRRISFVYHAYQSAEYIVSGHYSRSQVLNVGPQRRD